MLNKLTSVLTALLLLGAFSFAQAQDMPMEQQPAEPIEVSDEELEEWVGIYVGVQELDQQFQMQLPQVLEDAGIEIEKFQEIMQSQEMGQSRDEIEATSEEWESFDAAMDEIEEMQEEIEEEMQEHVEDEGMEWERYEEIMMGIQQDPELMEKAEELIMEEQGMEGQQQQQQQAPPQDPS